MDNAHSPLKARSGNGLAHTWSTIGSGASSALASSVVSGKSDYKKAEVAVAGYHERCLRELTEHIADAIDHYRAGDLDPFEVEAINHQYHRAATELWKFCWAGSGSHVRTAARFIQNIAANGEVIDWWERGSQRRR